MGEEFETMLAKWVATTEEHVNTFSVALSQIENGQKAIDNAEIGITSEPGTKRRKT